MIDCPRPYANSIGVPTMGLRPPQAPRSEVTITQGGVEKLTFGHSHAQVVSGRGGIEKLTFGHNGIALVGGRIGTRPV